MASLGSKESKLIFTIDMYADSGPQYHAQYEIETMGLNHIANC